VRQRSGGAAQMATVHTACTAAPGPVRATRKRTAPAIFIAGPASGSRQWQ
jgi:hypothetical protein